MGTFVKVDADLASLHRFSASMIRKQLPYASAKALTELALELRDEERREIERRFTVRTPWILRGVQINRAEKRDWPACRAEVGSRDRFMPLQETGGEKLPHAGRDLALPSDNVKTGERGRIPLGSRPKKALRRKRTFIATLTQGQSKGKRAIVRRATRDRYPLQVLYIFRGKAQVRPRLGFEKTARSFVARRYQTLFTAALQHACETSRAYARPAGHH